MKNIIFLVIDAFCYNNLERKVGNEYTTPFLRNLGKDNIVASNVYTQAPYTEAALVSILSGENTLEHGGYLLGNRTIENTVFEKYKNRGYHIISQYSPYVYSKAYLRDVDEYYYTRLVNIQVLFDYRFSYYRERYFGSMILESEYRICEALLGEEFQTWLLQCENILSRDPVALLIQDWVDEESIRVVMKKLKIEYEKFQKDRKNYLKGIFDDFDQHILCQLSKEYNTRKALPLRSELQSEFQNVFDEMQLKYNVIVKHNLPDLKYLINTLVANRSGYRDFKGLVHNYMRYYRNTFIKDYFRNIDNQAKTEVCMKRQFEHVLGLIDRANEQGYPALAYMHVQDYHLPTVIHSVDYDDKEYVSTEIRNAVDFFYMIDDMYKGNIMADLGARFIDNKVKELFNKLKQKYDDNFIFVVTADHGYPFFFDPPRPVIYNQTFVEAFHIPYIAYASGVKRKMDEIYSSMDLFRIFDCDEKIDGKEYVLSEYGGPGCPAIYEKPIWYTYIDERFRVSAELRLHDDIDYNCLKGVYDLKTDKEEKNNIVKGARKNSRVGEIMQIINRRNKELREKFDESLLDKYIQ